MGADVHDDIARGEKRLVGFLKEPFVVDRKWVHDSIPGDIEGITEVPKAHGWHPVGNLVPTQRRTSTGREHPAWRFALTDTAERKMPSQMLSTPGYFQRLPGSGLPTGCHRG